MDIYHKVFLVARREHLHKAPLIPNYDGPRILDIGTGTGIWAIDMAESVDSVAPDTMIHTDRITGCSKYPRAEVCVSRIKISHNGC